MHINKKTFNKKSFWATILVVQFVLFYLLSKWEIAISIFDNFFELQKNFHQQLFSWFPFSLGDIAYIFLGVCILILIVRLFYKKRRSKALLHLFITFNIFYFLYQIFWGMLYFQEPLINKLPKEEPRLQEVKILALQYLEKCKNTREFTHQDENGIFKVENWDIIKKDIISQQQLLPSFLNAKKPSKSISVKPSFYGYLMNYSGILGYYNPFTAEAQYNKHLPDTFIPFTIAHESSHQIGYAREQEANFIGYLMGINSNNIELRYSTEYYTLRSLLNYIQYEDPSFVKQILLKYSPKMKQDREFEKDFVEKHQGLMDDFFAFTNDIFLQSNQQEGSVTYSYFIDLLVRYERIKKESYH